MKKVAFVTIHVGANFGSVLQTIATSEVLRKIGADPVCIDYRPDRVTKRRFWSFENVGIVRNLFRLIWKIYTYPNYLMNNHLYQGFLKKHVVLSRPIYSNDCFEKLCPKAQYYITGSDQVWNFKHNEGCDGHYFFEGVKGDKISYSSSIGLETLSVDQTRYLKHQLSSYKAISVRESSAVELLKQSGISAVQIIDPTFQLDKESWVKYTSKRIVKEPYLFIYMPYNVADLKAILKTAYIIANKRNLKIVTNSTFYNNIKGVDITIKNATPGDFLSLMNNADFVLTNSFHGTAFSINLNKQFIVFLPSGFGTRILSILQLCNLTERLVSNELDAERVSCETIIYDDINIILNNERERTISFLKKYIV